jgi:hypothetical protein
MSRRRSPVHRIFRHRTPEEVERLFATPERVEGARDHLADRSLVRVEPQRFHRLVVCLLVASGPLQVGREVGAQLEALGRGAHARRIQGDVIAVVAAANPGANGRGDQEGREEGPSHPGRDARASDQTRPRRGREHEKPGRGEIKEALGEHGDDRQGDVRTGAKLRSANPAPSRRRARRRRREAATARHHGAQKRRAPGWPVTRITGTE